MDLSAYDVPPPLPPALVPLDGADWNRVIPVRDTDGDTVRIRRQQITWEQVSDGILGGSLRMTDTRLRVVQDDPEVLPHGQPARLVNLDTPERGEDGWAEASAMLWGWVTEHADRLRCITYTTGGGFDRLLVDLYVLAADGQSFEDSASQFMLRNGWPPYVEGQ